MSRGRTELLDRVERMNDAEAWTELGHRLILEHDLVSLAGIAALPRLIRLAWGSAEARHLAAEVMERAAGHHGGDELLADSAQAIAEFAHSWTGTCRRGRSITW